MWFFIESGLWICLWLRVTCFGILKEGHGCLLSEEGFETWRRRLRNLKPDIMFPLVRCKRRSLGRVRYIGLLATPSLTNTIQQIQTLKSEGCRSQPKMHPYTTHNSTFPFDFDTYKTQASIKTTQELTNKHSCKLHTWWLNWGICYTWMMWI